MNKNKNASEEKFTPNKGKLSTRNLRPSMYESKKSSNVVLNNLFLSKVVKKSKIQVLGKSKITNKFVEDKCQDSIKFSMESNYIGNGWNSVWRLPNHNVVSSFPSSKSNDKVVTPRKSRNVTSMSGKQSNEGNSLSEFKL